MKQFVLWGFPPPLARHRPPTERRRSVYSVVRPRRRLSEIAVIWVLCGSACLLGLSPGSDSLDRQEENQRAPISGGQYGVHVYFCSTPLPSPPPLPLPNTYNSQPPVDSVAPMSHTKFCRTLFLFVSLCPFLFLCPALCPALCPSVC